MVSYSGYWQLPLITQSFELTDKREYPNKKLLNPDYDKNSVMGYLYNNSDYKLFAYILKTAGIDLKVNDSQFNSTLIVCDNKRLQEGFIMSLDRNCSLGIANYSTIIRPLDIKSLKTRVASKIDTKNRGQQINFLQQGSGELFMNSIKVLGEHKCNNGNIIFIDGLLTYPGFFVKPC